ncbi:unnamed protein product [Effrenium voratum]|nr:unnamed protein product [Effrenium voratum]
MTRSLSNFEEHLETLESRLANLLDNTRRDETGPGAALDARMLAIELRLSALDARLRQLAQPQERESLILSVRSLESLAAKELTALHARQAALQVQVEEQVAALAMLQNLPQQLASQETKLRDIQEVMIGCWLCTIHFWTFVPTNAAVIGHGGGTPGVGCLSDSSRSFGAQTPPEPGRSPPSTDNSESSGSDQGTEQEAEEADNVEALPSVGSYNHMAGTCNPCRFVQGRRGVLGCRIGFHCNYCHMCHAPVEQPTSRPRKKVREGYKASILAIRDSDQSAAAKRKAIQQLKEKGAYARGDGHKSAVQTLIIQFFFKVAQLVAGIPLSKHWM